MKKVMEMLGNDIELAKKMGKCKTAEEGYELAKTVADGFTLEEFKETMLKLKDSLLSGSETGEFTDEDLESVAGGLSESDGTVIMLCVFAAGL